MKKDPTLTAAERLYSLNSGKPVTVTEAVIRLLPLIEEALRQNRGYAEILAELKTAGVVVNAKSFPTILVRARKQAAKRSNKERLAPEPTITTPATQITFVEPENTLAKNKTGIDSGVTNADRIIRPKVAATVEHNDSPSLKDFV